MQLFSRFKNKLIFFCKKKKLVMTLLVRNEDDIIRQNIEYHLAHGVDFIIAMDNGSVDNTRNILLEFQKKGVLFLMDEQSHDNSQARFVNQMGKIAYEKYNADVIIHCDADEFWFPKEGNLKTEIIQSSCDVLSVNVINILLEDCGGHESFPQNAKYSVMNPIKTTDMINDSIGKNIYFFKYPNKLMFKTLRGYLKVNKGNHSIEKQYKDFNFGPSNHVQIYHFPMRGKKKFVNKVINSGSATDSNKLLNKNTSWHIRRWYKAYKNGTLDQEYQKLIVHNDEVKELKKEGIIKNFDFNEFIKR